METIHVRPGEVWSLAEARRYGLDHLLYLLSSGQYERLLIEQDGAIVAVLRKAPHSFRDLNIERAL